MNVRTLLKYSGLLSIALPLFGANALIVHDGAGGLSANVVSNLQTKLAAASYTVSTNVGVPAGSLASYAQVWDVRYSNSTPLSATDITAYVAYLAGGGSLFVMGENTGFMPRNNTIVSLIGAAGGGSVTVTNPVSNTQTVQAPFTGPNQITTVTYLASASALPAYGTGAAITKDAEDRASAVVWSPGRLSAAPAGSLIVVFDVNFMQTDAFESSQAFLANLVAYLADPIPVGPQPPTGIPALSTWTMVLLAGLMTAAGAWRIFAASGRTA
jgi:hypothetical protein